ncbi:MAG: hypothetical protein CM1200mP41_36750 [Gammaproteobacteria bacterium]|nr:MAG: hypothetical protein CM1200mP41_36750 [Gammaproteobacteria bacterium]
MIDPAVREGELIVPWGCHGRRGFFWTCVWGTAHIVIQQRLCPCFVKALPDRPVVIASVTGTKGDPQDREHSFNFERRRCPIAPTNADAARLALTCLSLTINSDRISRVDAINGVCLPLE